MNRSFLAAILPVLLGIGCASSPSARSTMQSPSLCEPPERALEHIAIGKHIIGDAVLEGMHFPPGQPRPETLYDQGETFHFASAYQMTGICAHRISYYSDAPVPIFYVLGSPDTTPRTAEVLIMAKDSPTPFHIKIIDKKPFFYDTTYSTDPHPHIPGATFIMAREITTLFHDELEAVKKYGKFELPPDGRRPSPEDHKVMLGLWQTPQGAFIGSFVQMADGRFGPVMEEFSTRFPVDSLLYFPGHNAPLGTISLVARKNGETWLISQIWYHPRYEELEQMVLQP
ncbi:hypothetical protein CO613_07815 [Lysobacteraceae bacterium NML07-0707]|nr:hypothetical protein CO613_07815 [Xanthomonadaceae bacterium NML07-0707]